MGPWCIVGDFNSVMGVHDKCGRPHLLVACDNFREAIDLAKVLQIDIVGPFYTWARSGVYCFVASKLGRALCSKVCLDF